MSHRRLLWTDDDGPKHFLYELAELEARGWTVRWARSVTEALRWLCAEPFEALIVDQLLPVAEAEQGVVAERFVWGGALIVAWLRAPEALAALPAPLQALAAPLTAQRPHPENIDLPVQLVSAFDDAEVDALLNSAALGAPRRIPKPVDLDDLLLLIEETERALEEDREGERETEAETEVGARGPRSC